MHLLMKAVLLKNHDNSLVYICHIVSFFDMHTIGGTETKLTFSTLHELVNKMVYSSNRFV